MLAGYLPFDDDPANPEGDNINLLYKYIVSTPLTFPEYVTPHARDMLKRILVPDPRKRADLFEVARHSWLSEYAHVVGFITSSTTTETDIVNTTVPAGESPVYMTVKDSIRHMLEEGQRRFSLPLPKTKTNSWRRLGTLRFRANLHIEDLGDTPLLARSASVREPSKPHAAVPAVGGLTQKTGQVDQPSDKGKTPRDVKRRTVQVEYVAPQSSTIRGEPSSAGKTRARSGSQGPVEVAPPPPPKNYESADRKQPVLAAPASMPPPARPGRDQQRAASESVTQSVVAAQSGRRPSTQGSMTSNARMPSRGNSYGQPAVAVNQEQAQGRFSQPKKHHYTISTPNAEEQAIMGSQYGDGAGPAKDSYARDSPPARRGSNTRRSHKRSSTLGEKIGSIFGRNSVSYEQKQDEKAERQPSKKYPPMAMKQPFVDNGNAERRQSSDSRRTSFSFSRKNTDQASTKRSSRRFSLIQSLKGFGSRDSSQQPPGSAGSSQRRVAAPRSRHDSRARLGFRSDSRSPSRSTTNSTTMPPYYDERVRDSPPQAQAHPMGGPTSHPYATAAADRYPYQNGYNSTNSHDLVAAPADPPPVPNSQQLQNDLPYRPGKYPPGFNDFDDDEALARSQGGRLQKHKRFTDAYEGERGGAGSGAPRRVMDFFRRIGSRRQGDER